MNDTRLLFSEQDLLFLIQTLIPDCNDHTKMMRVLRDDREILEGMLNDEKLCQLMVENPDSIIRVSSQMFFTVLLNRVKKDLKSKSFTVEQEARIQMVIFDSEEVYDLVNEIKMRNYLADMLASFAKINSFTIPIRVRKGVWRKFRFSDFDINSLIKYSQMIEEDQRYHTYKRIADVCLFTIGIFPDFLNISHTSLGEQFRGRTQKSREDFADYGRYFYKAASKHKVAQVQEIDRLLMTLSDNIKLAAKPLNYMVKQYLGTLKRSYFFNKTELCEVLLTLWVKTLSHADLKSLFQVFEYLFSKPISIVAILCWPFLFFLISLLFHGILLVYTEMLRQSEYRTPRP